MAENILTANPDVDVFWASNDGGTAGAVIGTKGSKASPVFGTDISDPDRRVHPRQTTASCRPRPARTRSAPPRAPTRWPRRSSPAKQLDQHSVELPGIVYDRANPETTNTFLGK